MFDVASNIYMDVMSDEHGGDVTNEKYYRASVSLDRDEYRELARYLEDLPRSLRKSFLIEALRYYYTHFDEIYVESQLGKGSTFNVYLPKFMESYLGDETIDDAVPTGRERVLFTDDEEALAEIGKDVLSDLGYKVTVMTSSKEALALLEADPAQFDLIITDQTMPDMTGIELAREVLSIRPDMPIIMCTGYGHLVDADKARAAGVRAFAMKPLTQREIARTIRQVLEE